MICRVQFANSGLFLVNGEDKEEKFEGYEQVKCPFCDFWCRSGDLKFHLKSGRHSRNHRPYQTKEALKTKKPTPKLHQYV